MPASRFVAESRDPRSQFLDGLTPADRKTTLAAATTPILREFYDHKPAKN